MKLAALLLVLSAAPLQAQSGVLLGLSNGTTLWIAPDAGGTLRVRQRLGEVIVPRRDGFWRVGFRYQRTPPRAADSAGFQPGWGEACPTGDCPRQDGLMLFAGPLGSQPPRYVLSDLEREVLASVSTLHLDLTHVGPTYVSATRHAETDAGGMLSYSTVGMVALLDDLRRSPYRALADETPAADPAGLDSAATAAVEQRCAAQYGDADDVGIALPLEDVAMMAGRSTYIAHDEGRWRLMWQYSISSGVARGFSWACDTGLELPGGAVVEPRLPLTWETIAREVPGARDAVASPTGDMIVVVTDQDLRVYTSAAGGLTRPVLTLHEPDARIVMAEWASGRHVARWQALLAPHMLPYSSRQR